jgi:ribosome biogenesis GTPase
MINLDQYGWNEHFEAQYKNSKNYGNCVARVIADFGQKLRLISGDGEVLATKAPHFFTTSGIDVPAVGDWVVFKEFEDQTEPMILEVLKRKTKFSRAAAGIELKEQVVAANVDIVFLIQSLNKDFNLRRLERYLIAAWESGATPVVVLTKADICTDWEIKIQEVYEICTGMEVLAVSSLTGQGMDAVKSYLEPGRTIALLGSSGVGKSTLVNMLSGKEMLKTQEIREGDSRGRHTTTHRELVLLPEGGLILDTPGMRTLSLWEAEEGMNEVFGEIEELITKCRFSDCLHKNEPGCAVRSALQKGTLSEKRWNNWLKLQKELLFLDQKKDGKLREERKRQHKEISKFQESKI